MRSLLKYRQPIMQMVQERDFCQKQGTSVVTTYRGCTRCQWQSLLLTIICLRAGVISSAAEPTKATKFGKRSKATSSIADRVMTLRASFKAPRKTIFQRKKSFRLVSSHRVQQTCMYHRQIRQPLWWTTIRTESCQP